MPEAVMAGSFHEGSSSASISEPPLPSVMDALTLRAVSSAIFLGSAICFANMYLGLQAGIVNAMPMQSALLAFALFRSMQHRLSKPLSPAETTAIEVVAGALGLAPFTSGYTGIIPALEFLVTPAENGPKSFSVARLLVWSIAICFLGAVVAAPFRPIFILRERLRYPSATATGTLIGMLFGKETIVARAQQPKILIARSHNMEVDTSFDRSDGLGRDEVNPTESRSSDDVDESFVGGAVGHTVRVLLVSFAGSSLFSLISYFVPMMRSLPIFGYTAARDWMWAFDLSPAYFGYGIIIGPRVNMSLLLGAIIGWGILSPVAKYNGWAPGQVNSWDDGSRGWIVWVGMGFILGDSAVGLGWTIFKPTMLWAASRLESQRPRRTRTQQGSEQAPLLDQILDMPRKGDMDDSGVDDEWSPSSLVPTSLILQTGAVLLVVYLVSFLGIFRDLVTPLATLIALLLVPLAGLISMRSLGETDNGASLAIGRVAQFIIGLSVPTSYPNYIFANLLLGGAVETGASQASQQMGGLKTAYMTKTAPRTIFYGQMIGSLAGTLIATLVYKVYTSVKTIPSDEFGIPDAHLWLVAAKLIYQQGLPPRALDFATGAFFIGAAFSMLRILASNRWWQYLVPSSIAMAIGMYIVPAVILPRALGSLILVIGCNRLGMTSFVLMGSATGLILGQGIFSLVTLMFDALHIPHL